MANVASHNFPTGESIDLNSEDWGSIQVESVLWPLSRERRFSNAVDWTVLQHSLLVGRVAQVLYPDNLPLIRDAYFHDAQEAIVRDVSTPIKKLVGEAWYTMEANVHRRLMKALGVEGTSSSENLARVKEIDFAVLALEVTSFFPFDIAYSIVGNKPVDIQKFSCANYAIVKVIEDTACAMEEGPSPNIVREFKLALFGVVL